MLSEFLLEYSTEIITIFFSIVAALLPIPMIIRNILHKLDQANKTKIEIKDAEKKLMELTVTQDELETILNSAILSNVVEEQDDPETTPPSPQSHDYLSTYSSKKNSLSELYEKRNTDKALKKVSFTLAVIMSVVGTIILFVGILFSLFY